MKMEEVKHYYRILELKPGASADEIKRAYKDLAKVWHPDRFPNDLPLQQRANEKLKEINSAYQGLMGYLEACHDEIFEQQKERPTAKEKGYEKNTSEFSERIPCIDGNCIGTLNEFGCCNICGKRYKSEGVKSNFKNEDVEDDFSKRKPCPDGNCIGTINEYGYCNICRKRLNDKSYH
jgi:DnaJ-class molecular chaperone